MVTVLLVDDDISILEVTAAILEYTGYTVVTASNGQEALEYLTDIGTRDLEKLQNGDLPDLILSDTMMPLMDGRELCRRQQAISSYGSIPFVLMSAASSAPDRDLCNYAAFVAKPFETPELLITLERVLDEQHKR